MADGTKIEWTDATWNIVTGCSVVSPGCTNCYAMKLAGTRLRNHPSRQGLTIDTKAGPVWSGEVRFNRDWLDQPLRWKAPRMIFVAAHGDLFADGVTDEQLDQIFAIMALCPQHIFQVLTKRPERMKAYLTTPRWRPILDFGQDEHPSYWIAEKAGAIVIRLPGSGVSVPSHVRTFGDLAQFERDLKARASNAWPLPNVWLGVSVEDQRRADERIPMLLKTPAAIRWISAEPLLGPLDLGRWTATANVTCKRCGAPFWLHDADPCNHRNDGDGWTLACPHCGDCRCVRGWTEADARTIAMEPPADWIDRKVGRFVKVHPTIAIGSRIDWVVAGGESGRHARSMHPDWARSLRDQCAAANTPFLFKQWGNWRPSTPEEADGNPHSGWLSFQGRVDRAVKASELYPEARAAFVERVTKKEAGRLLDGVEHNGFPTLPDHFKEID